MNPETDFNQYKENSYKTWRKKILLISLVCSIIIFLIELGIYITLHQQNLIVTSNLRYVLLRIVTPAFLNFSTLFFVTLLCKSKNKSPTCKNFAVTITFFMIASVISIFHNYFTVLLIACAFPFFICTIFADTSIMKKLGILTIPSFIISAVVFWFDKETGLPLYKLLIILCSSTFIICSYCYANAQVKFHKNQLDYIHLSYQRQFELLKELRIDPLTNIANRVYMKEVITKAIYRAEKDDVESFLVMLDLDHFKNVNDKYGHTSGDTVLIKLAEILKQNTEFLGNAFRYGGEEFIVIFENTNLQLAKSTIEKICSDFASSRFSFSSEERFTLSAGISTFKKGLSLIQWIDNSDSALYYAKTHGRNQICIFEDISEN